MGKRRHEKRELTKIERLFCCCKCRGECKTRDPAKDGLESDAWVDGYDNQNKDKNITIAKNKMTQCFIYFFMTTLIIGLAVACITIGVIYRENCSHNSMVPYWLLSSSITPAFLFFFIKGIQQKHVGVTCWRTVSLFGYLFFLTWLVIGCSWVYPTWIYVMNTCSSCCEPILINAAFALTFVHWLFAIAAIIPNIYIVYKMCCFNKNAIMPLKSNVPYA